MEILERQKQTDIHILQTACDKKGIKHMMRCLITLSCLSTLRELMFKHAFPKTDNVVIMCNNYF